MPTNDKNHETWKWWYWKFQQIIFQLPLIFLLVFQDFFQLETSRYMMVSKGDLFEINTRQKSFKQNKQTYVMRKIEIFGWKKKNLRNWFCLLNQLKSFEVCYISKLTRLRSLYTALVRTSPSSIRSRLRFRSCFRRCSSLAVTPVK